MNGSLLDKNDCNERYPRFTARSFRCFSLFLAAMMAFLGLGGTAAYGASGSTYTAKLTETFENCQETVNYSSSLEGTGISYIGPVSSLRIEGNAGSISGGRSLRIASCDLRYWGLNIEDKQFSVGFSVKIGRNYEGELKFCVSTQDPETGTESLGGMLFHIKNGPDGNTFLRGSDDSELFELKKDTVYKITAEITRGKNECTVTVNGETLPLTFRFRSAFYCITGLRIFAPEPQIIQYSGPSDDPSQTAAAGASEETRTDSPDGPETTYSPDQGGAVSVPFVPNDNNTILIDDIDIGTMGRVYPQKYSVQTPGKMPKNDTESSPDPDKVRVFINGKEIDMSKTYETESTIYISAEQFLKGISVNYSYDKNEKKLTITDGKLKVYAHVPGDEIEINGKTVSLLYQVRTIDDVIMITPNFISEVFNAKVWWDKASKLLVITSGSQKNDGFLRLIGGKLYMNGEPYYEISFNKFDLFYQIWADYAEDRAYPSEEFRKTAAEAALKQLRENGFRSIRVFCHADIPELMYDAVVKGKFYQAVDDMIALCKKYGIKVVVSLGLISDNFVAKQRIDGYGLVNKDESVPDLVASAGSESRKIVANYLREFVERYKSENTILMYEISNEGNLDADVGNTVEKVCYSLGQLADFYTFCANTIHSVDSKRVVTGGDAVLRNAQYNLYRSTMAGSLKDDWTTDTEEERLYVLTLLNGGIDAVSTHTYGLGDPKADIAFDKDGVKTYYGFDFLVKEAAGLGKPLYNGETNVYKKPGDSGYADSVRKYLNSIIDAGVQLTHWWTFRSDRQGFDDDESWRNDSGEVFEAIKAANAAIREKYVVNGVADENTYEAGWREDEEIIDPDKIVSGIQPSKETSRFQAILWAAIIGGSMVLLCGLAVLFFRLRIKHGNR